MHAPLVDEYLRDMRHNERAHKELQQVTDLILYAILALATLLAVLVHPFFGIGLGVAGTIAMFVIEHLFTLGYERNVKELENGLRHAYMR